MTTKNQMEQFVVPVARRRCERCTKAECPFKNLDCSEDSKAVECLVLGGGLGEVPSPELK